MAIIGGLLSLVGRFAGQILNMTLGWATILLFGKVPQKRQFVLLILVFGSLAWVALVIGVLVPDVGSFLVAATPVSPFVDISLLRLAMLGAALTLPLVIGMAAVSVSEKEKRPTGMGLVIAVLRGYPFAAVLALLMVVLAAIAIIRKVRSMSKHWEDTHVPVIIKPGHYEEMLALLQSKLDESGLKTTPRDAGPFISGPPKLLDLVAGRALGSLVPDRLQLLVGDNLELLVYPSDLSISGTKLEVARARAAIVIQLAEAPAYMTTSAEAQKFEDQLESLGPGAASSRPDETVKHVRSLDPELVKLAVPFEEWETLFRMRLQMERDALTTTPTLKGTGGSNTRDRDPDERRGLSRLDLGIALGSAALLIADVALLIGARRNGEQKQS
jgi:hypothetical protein